MNYRTEITHEDIRQVVEQYIDFNNEILPPSIVRVAKREFTSIILKEVNWHMEQEENLDPETGEHILSDWEYGLVVASILSVLRERPGMTENGITIKRHPSEKEFEEVVGS